MSSANNIPTEAILVDVELAPVEDVTIAVESQSTEEQPLHHNRNNANATNAVKSYQSTAPTSKIRTISTASDESSLLPDVGYIPALSKIIFLFPKWPIK